MSESAIEVDHEIHFEQLYCEFLKNNTIPVPTDFDENWDGRQCFKEIDKLFSQEWQKYHKENSQLRILCQPCNSKREKYKN